jgi:FixJ family two-component response regulator
LRVLVIDDQEKILEYVEDILIDISPDIEVVSRTSWASAEPVLEKDAAFDLILLDVVIPEIDGIKIHQMLKDNFNLSERVVFMTGASLIGVILERPFIRKPFTEKDIFDLVMEYCPEDEIEQLMSQGG